MTTKSCNQRRGEKAAQPVAQVGVDLVPDIAHGGQAIAEMRNPLLGADILGHGVADGEHEIVALDFEMAGGPGVERQQLAVMAPHAGKSIQGRSPNLQGIDGGGCRPWLVEERVEVSLGQRACEGIEYAFAASHAGHPIVDECDSHPLMIAARRAPFGFDQPALGISGSKVIARASSMVSTR